MLTISLKLLEMHDAHLLNWGLTKMAVFLDACLQVSVIIVPFLDTIIGENIRPDKTRCIASPKGN